MTAERYHRTETGPSAIKIFYMTVQYQKVLVITFVDVRSVRTQKILFLWF